MKMIVKKVVASSLLIPKKVIRARLIKQFTWLLKLRTIPMMMMMVKLTVVVVLTMMPIPMPMS